jgi:alpha-beta hydrolase superfamily lysophospholipase
MHTSSKNVKRLLLRGCSVILLLYLGIVAYVAATQDRFLYQPSREPEAALLRLARSHGLEPIRDSNQEITGWRLPNAAARRRVIVSHGGAGHALQRLFYAQALDRLGWEVSLFEYPGFGARRGAPGRDSFLRAGDEFIQAAFADDDRRPVYLLGEIMGSGTACILARQNHDQIAGLALVVPYARMAEVAKKRMPCLPVDLILRDT